ncbi:helix-turn-helix domain-containing protein [uncultured Amnibacterium sp.]|uniref:AraC family transcriptional regulator n=1 Tax=uncultured Amnibacterium sp. TaxID=1631851 RepID=UPI0035CADC41
MAGSVTRFQARTSDLDEGVAVTRAAFGDGVDMAPPERGATDVAVRRLEAQGLRSIRWRAAGAGTGSRDGRHDCRRMLLASTLLRGGLVFHTDDERSVDTSRPFLHPELLDCDLDAPDLASLAVPEELLVARARAMTGDDAFQLRFRSAAPSTPTLDRVWRNTMVYAERTLTELVDEPDADLAATGLVDLVVTQLLHVFPNSALEVEDERAAGPATANAAVRRALRFIDENLQRPFSAVELAGSSGLSLRGLHAAFLRELETTPMRFVRDTRLMAARAELREAGDAPIDVRRLAIRWGFPSEASFARRYRAVFAEAPDATRRLGSSDRDEPAARAAQDHHA